MGIIRCTAKLLTELKAKPTNGLSQSSNWCDWHANLLWADRKKCVLFTNNNTLYPFLLHSIKKPILENFEEVFRLGLFKRLITEGFSDPQVEYVLREHQQIVIEKTNSRSILGSMNDLSFQIKYMIRATGGHGVVEKLMEVAQNRGLPKSIRIDNGPEFTSKALDQWAYLNGVKLDFIRPGKPTDNALIEAFNGHFREECLNESWFLSIEDAREKAEEWRKHYNWERPHGALGNVPPLEFAGAMV